MPFSMSKTTGKLSLLAILIVFVAAGVLTVSQRITTHADTTGTISNMPTSFHETVGSDTYTWTLQKNPSDTNTSVDSGTWDVKEGSTDLGTVDSNVTIGQDSSGLRTYNVTTTSTIPGVASALSGSSEELVPVNTGGLDGPSPFGQQTDQPTNGSAPGTEYTISADLNTSQGLNLQTTDGTLGPEMVKNMDNLITTQENAYSQAENAYQAKQGNTGNNTLALAGSLLAPLSFNQAARPAALPIPIAALVLAGAGMLLTTVGGIISSVCNHTSCGSPSATKAWAIAGGIMSALGTLAVIISGASVTGWVIAARAEAAALSSAVPAVAMGERMAEGTVAAAAADTAIASDIATMFPEVAIAS